MSGDSIGVIVGLYYVGVGAAIGLVTGCIGGIIFSNQKGAGSQVF
jgi:hypothetical protein